MAKDKVVPVIVRDSRSVGPAAEELYKYAYEIAVRAEKAKIDDWVNHFDFELTQPIEIRFGPGINVQPYLENIITTVQNSGSSGVVVAGIDFLDRANLASDLIKNLSHLGKKLWDASQGTEPVTDKLRSALC